jgi:hypothetical protein
MMKFTKYYLYEKYVFIILFQKTEAKLDIYICPVLENELSNVE